MRPGMYLQLRRRAAGLSIDEVAICMRGQGEHGWADRLLAFELDNDVAGPSTLERLRAIYPFDATVYGNLVERRATGPICRQCGCTQNDACIGAGQNCHWVETNLCSACAAPVHRTPSPSFTITGEDPFAVAILTILGALKLGAWAGAEKELLGVIARHRNAFTLSARHEIDADTVMRAADAMHEWREQNLGHLPKGEPVHV